MDRLGNWTGDETNPGRALEGNLGGTGVSSTRAITHAVDMTNGIGSIAVDTGTGPVQTQVHHDAAGNLISDGVYVYQYDGLNRLSKVSQIGSLSCTSGTWSGTAGPWLIQYSYDALGRLCRAQRPWPSPSLSETRIRTEHFYYDGVRRIQEEFTDPLELVNPGGGDEGIDSGDEEGGQGNLSTTLTWVEREYIWSAAVGAGVDELVCQVAPTGTSWATERIHYALTESTGTVVGLADTAGVAKAQYHWDPYGELLAVDLAAGVPRNRVGHQGLFMDRLDIGTQHEQLVRGADVLAQNRNRTYAPALGRFLQRDPNQSGVMTALGGRGAGLPAASLSVQGMYGDGVSLYGYTRGNPVTWTDPQGTFGLIGGLMTGLDIADSSLDTMEQAYAGVQQWMGLKGMIDEYAFGQVADVEWAMDWSQPDDAHSRGASADETDLEGGGRSLAMGWKGRSSGNPAAKKPWDAARMHGSPTHWKGMKREYKKLVIQLKEQGYTVRPGSIRTNQALCNVDGETVSNLRPDVQLVATRGDERKVFVIEYAHTQARDKLLGRKQSFIKALGNEQYGGYSHN